MWMYILMEKVNKIIALYYRLDDLTDRWYPSEYEEMVSQQLYTLWETTNEEEKQAVKTALGDRAWIFK